MKKSLFTQLMLFAVMSLFVFSCSSDDDAGGVAPPLQPKLEGFYVYGTNTVAESPLDPKSRMAGAILNPAKSDGKSTTDGVYGRFMYIGANSTIQFTNVVGEEATVYGAEDGGTVTYGLELDYTDIADDIIHGDLVPDAAPIKIAEEGLYYVFANTNDETFRIMKVKAQVFGPASPFGYDAGTPLPLKSTDVNKTVFEGTNIAMKGADGYRYRFNEGYELYSEEGKFATLNQLAIPADAYGDAWEAGPGNFDIGYYDANMPNHDEGMFMLTLTFNAATGEWTETKERTGDLEGSDTPDLPDADFATIKMGLIGNAFEVDGKKVNWDIGYELHAPDQEGNTFTWTWDNVDLIEGGEFIFLEVNTEEDGPWGGVQFDYKQTAVVQGAAIDNKDVVDATTDEGEFHNYKVMVGGLYNISLVVDIDAGTSTVTIVPNN